MPTETPMTTDTRALARELEPCPFCGQQPSHVERWDLSSYAVLCYCDARGPLDQNGDYVGEPEETATAARLWNARALSLTPTDTRGWEAELLRQAMNTLGAITDGNDPTDLIADNGMTVWDGLRSESERLWAKYRALATLTPPPHDPEEGAPHV